MVPMLQVKMFIVAGLLDAVTMIDAGEGVRDYCTAKLATCEFYFKRLQPRTATHRAAVEAGSDCLMQLPAELFAL